MEMALNFERLLCFSLFTRVAWFKLSTLFCSSLRAVVFKLSSSEALRKLSIASSKSILTLDTTVFSFNNRLASKPAKFKHN